MSTRNCPAPSIDQISSDEFLSWLEENSTTALVSEKHDRYYAYCFEFGIAGSGETEREAVEDAANLLVRYLVTNFSEGRSYRDAKKRPPAQIRLRSWYLLARHKMRGVRPLSRLGGLISVPTTSNDAHRLAH